MKRLWFESSDLPPGRGNAEQRGRSSMLCCGRWWILGLGRSFSALSCFWNISKVGLVNLPPLELDLIKELLKGRVVPAPGHLGLPQLQLQHHVLEDLKRQQLDVPCQALRTTWWRVQVVDLTLLRSYFRLRDWTSRLNVFCASWVLVGLVGASRLVAASSSWGRCVQSILRTTFSSHVSKSLFQTQIADYFSYFYCNQYKILTKSLVKIYFLQ